MTNLSSHGNSGATPITANCRMSMRCSIYMPTSRRETLPNFPIRKSSPLRSRVKQRHAVGKLIPRVRCARNAQTGVMGSSLVQNSGIASQLNLVATVAVMFSAVPVKGQVAVAPAKSHGFVPDVTNPHAINVTWHCSLHRCDFLTFICTSFHCSHFAGLFDLFNFRMSAGEPAVEDLKTVESDCKEIVSNVSSWIDRTSDKTLKKDLAKLASGAILGRMGFDRALAQFDEIVTCEFCGSKQPLRNTIVHCHRHQLFVCEPCDCKDNGAWRNSSTRRCGCTHCIVCSNGHCACIRSGTTYCNTPQCPCKTLPVPEKASRDVATDMARLTCEYLGDDATWREWTMSMQWFGSTNTSLASRHLAKRIHAGYVDLGLAEFIDKRLGPEPGVVLAGGAFVSFALSREPVMPRMPSQRVTALSTPGDIDLFVVRCSKEDLDAAREDLLRNLLTRNPSDPRERARMYEEISFDLVSKRRVSRPDPWIASDGTYPQHVPNVQWAHRVYRAPNCSWYVNVIGWLDQPHGVHGFYVPPTESAKEDAPADRLVDSFDFEFLRGWFIPPSHLHKEARVGIRNVPALLDFTSPYRAAGPIGMTASERIRAYDRINKYKQRGACITGALPTMPSDEEKALELWPACEQQLILHSKGFTENHDIQEIGSLFDYVTGIWGSFAWNNNFDDPHEHARYCAVYHQSLLRASELVSYARSRERSLEFHWSTKPRDLRAKYDAELRQIRHIISEGMPFSPRRLSSKPVNDLDAVSDFTMTMRKFSLDARLKLFRTLSNTNTIKGKRTASSEPTEASPLHSKKPKIDSTASSASASRH